MKAISEASVPPFFRYNGWMSDQLRDRGEYEVVPQKLVEHYKLLASEAALLGVEQAALAEKRCVYLCVNGKPWIYAETIMPFQTLTAFPGLRTLGRTPLGDFLKQNGARRGNICFFSCDSQTDWFKVASSNVDLSSKELLLRQSVFTFSSGEKLLISEMLLQPASFFL
tara:strand:- start:2794 stop:3297 length:504 start_codon:yes stop_codon:yes gene_type:complete